MEAAKKDKVFVASRRLASMVALGVPATRGLPPSRPLHGQRPRARAPQGSYGDGATRCLCSAMPPIAPSMRLGPPSEGVGGGGRRVRL